MAFGEDLQKARKGCNLTVNQVAQAVDKDRTTIWRWENDVTSPTIDDLAALFAAFPAMAMVRMRITKHLHLCSLDACPGYIAEQRKNKLN